MHETAQERRIQQLKQALAKRDRLMQELREVDAYITEEGRSYWKFLGYTAIPRLERLRAAILGA